MHRTIRVLFSLALIACAGRGGQDDGAPAGQAVTTGDTLSPLVGRWRLASDRPPAYGLGIRLDLAIDSLSGDRAFGRVTFMFSGNMGIDPATIGPLRGTLHDDSLLHLAADPPPSGGPRIRLSGVVRRDSVLLSEFRLGPDDFATGATRWVLVRDGG